MFKEFLALLIIFVCVCVWVYWGGRKYIKEDRKLIIAFEFLNSEKLKS